MSAHGLPGAAEVAVNPGLHSASDPRRAEVGEPPAAERGTSGSTNAVRPFRYRDLGSATWISRGRAGPPPGGCIPAGSWDGVPLE